MTATVIETTGVPPPPGAAAELTVPLCFMDFVWLHFHPIRRPIFYDHPCSESDFLNDVVPKLKHSLSLALQNYLPVAANLLYPLDLNTDEKPLIRYVSGDGVPLTVAVSAADFDELTGFHVKESDQFYDFMPEMPPVREEAGCNYKIIPLIAVQVTLFPGRGICVGLSNHHCLGDARSVVGFMWRWAEINKSGGDEDSQSENGESLPLFDRSVFGDRDKVNDMFWDAMKRKPFEAASFPLPTNRVRGAFSLGPSAIKKLKNRVLSSNQTLSHVSSFVVTAAYVWTSVVKSADAAGEEVAGDEAEIFFFPADGRGRPNAMVDQPVPLNYFGNFLGGGMVKMEHKKVAAEDGFLAVAEAISDQIKNNINNKEVFMKGTENWLSEMVKVPMMRSFGVSGSPKFDLSNADFGWGKARRLEVLSMDGEKYSMSLCNSSSSDGGLVVGVSLPAVRMEAFASIFEDGLKS